MNEEEYKELNYYLNESCLYLEKENSFFLRNIENICFVNDEFNSMFEDYNFENQVRENHLTFQEVYDLAREIIESINPDYLKDYDKLIQNGQLDFEYEGKYYNSEFVHIQKDNIIYNYININRRFNYNDVSVLVHEFIHYTNGKNKITSNRRVLTEFLSIYYEIYAIDYLINKGICKEEIDYTIRLKTTYENTSNFSKYEFPLICFLEFGSVSDNDYEMLKKYCFCMGKDIFNKNCYNLLYFFQNQKKKYMENLLANEKEDRIELQKKYGNYFSLHCRYLFGTLLAFYARKNCKKEDILYLNEHINDNGKSVIDCLKSIGINVDANDFFYNVFNSITEYIENYNIKKR